MPHKRSVLELIIKMLNLFAMTITPDQFKEIMRLFDAGDFESRKDSGLNLI